MKSFNHKKNGFTLIETMVAVFVFSVVMVLSTGAIFSIISANKTSQALKSVMDNLSSALDSMSREIRYGTIYNCIASSPNFTTPGSCGLGSKYISFVDRNNRHVVYRFNESDPNANNNKYIEKSVGDSPYVRLTAPEVFIEKLDFYVLGAEKTEFQHPQLLITVSGYAMAGTKKSYFNIETMVSQRNLACKQNVEDYLNPAPNPGHITCP